MEPTVPLGGKDLGDLRFRKVIFVLVSSLWVLSNTMQARAIIHFKPLVVVPSVETLPPVRIVFLMMFLTVDYSFLC